MRTRLPREQRERQMLETAHALFAERGYAAVTMDEVAGAVGVTKPLLYNYFGNKERLFLACMKPAGDALIGAVVAAVQEAETPAEALRSGIHAFFAFLEEDREAWRVLFDETLPSSGAIARRVSEYRDRLAALVTAALRERNPEPAVEPLSVALLGAAEALGRWWLRTRAIPADRAAELLIRTLEPGLRNP
jgi:AcrR family transcriptional regulator